MTPRSVFLVSQGWSLLVRDEEDGLWRSPQGGVCRAKEAEESALNAMAVGLAYFFSRSREISTATGKAALDVIRASVTAMLMRDLGELVSDPKMQSEIAVAVCKPEAMLPLRDFLRMVLALPDEPKKDVVLS